MFAHEQQASIAQYRSRDNAQVGHARIVSQATAPTSSRKAGLGSAGASAPADE
jgi:uncharacterized protein involved in exopolysaccharide biosynthesis